MEDHAPEGDAHEPPADAGGGEGDRILLGLTPEQQRAVEHGDGPLIVVAGPGSGKTRVIARRVAYLVERLGVPGWSVLAITFTNKAAEEMRHRIDDLLGRGVGVTVSTFHSFCARTLRKYGPVDRTADFSIYDEDDQRACVRRALDALKLEEKQWKPGAMLARISDAKNKRISADAFESHATAFQDRMAAKVYRKYEELLREYNALDFDDLLLAMLDVLEQREEVREDLRVRYKYVLVDEYQDTNRVQYEIANQLAGPGGNLCVVGDADQCLPPEALVQTPSGPRRIDEIREGDQVIAATGWGRTAPMPVDRVMKKHWSGELVRIRLASGRSLTATPNHVCFGRLDPRQGMHYVYLMWRRDKGYRIGTTTGVRASKDGVLLNGVQVRTNQEVADAVWILRACHDLGEARYFEQLYAIRYGIPTMVFHVRGRRMAVGQALVDQLFEELDTEAAADRLMADLELDRRFPHHRPYAVTRGDVSRKYIWFTVFGDPRRHTVRPWHEHRIQLVTSDAALRKTATGRFPVRDGARGTWRIETSRKDYDEGRALSDAIGSLHDELEVIGRARLMKGKAFQFLPASHLREGMTVPVLEGTKVIEDVVASIERVPFEGVVYDLSVPAVRNFVSEGVVVHNSIYKWRGADLRNLIDFEQDHPGAVEVRLEQNFRSTKRILAAAQGLIEHNTERREKDLYTDNAEGDALKHVRCLSDAEEARLVATSIEQRLREGVPPQEIAVFYRTNGLSRKFEEELSNRGIKHVVIGAVPFFARKEVKDVLSFVRLRANNHDDAALRRAIALAEGFGAKTLDRIAAFATATGISVLEAVARAAEAPELQARQRKSALAFFALVTEIFTMPEAPVGPLLRAVVERTGVKERLSKSEDPQDWARADNIEQLVNGAYEFDERNEGRTFREYLDQVALLVGAPEDKDPNTVKLMTLHAAKGLEFDEVYIAGVDGGLLPLERDMEPCDTEEERRLFYVGITRARKRVTLTSVQVRRTWGLEKLYRPSDFLKELPEQAVEKASSAFFGDRDAPRGVDLRAGPYSALGGARRRVDADHEFGDSYEGGDDEDARADAATDSFLRRARAGASPKRAPANPDAEEDAGDAPHADDDEISAEPWSSFRPKTQPQPPASGAPSRKPWDRRPAPWERPRASLAEGDRMRAEAAPAAAKPAPAARAVETPIGGSDPIREGERVVHPVFGRGDVVSVSGAGPLRRVKVRFDQAGDKQLVLQYAKLTRPA